MNPHRARGDQALVEVIALSIELHIDIDLCQVEFVIVLLIWRPALETKKIVCNAFR